MKWQLKVLLLSSALYLLAGGLFGPIYAIFVEKIGGNLLTAGTAYSAFALAAGIMIFFISKWEDKVKHQEKLIICGYALACLGYLGYLFVQTPLHLFIVQIIFGAGTAIGASAYDGLYSRHLDKGKFISGWGAWESMNWITLAISASLGGFIANSYGFRTLFIIMFVLSLFALVTSLMLLRKNHFKIA